MINECVPCARLATVAQSFERYLWRETWQFAIQVLVSNVIVKPDDTTDLGTILAFWRAGVS